MSDLTEKFSDLEQQLTTQHNAVMDALADIGASLDAIAIALEPPETPDATLADVLAAIIAGNVIASASRALLDGVIANTLGDIHADTMSMDGKLLTIRDDLADVHLDTMSMDGKLLTIRDLIDELHTDMHGIPQVLEDETSVLGLIRDLLDQLQTATGMPTGDATTTILGFLSSLQYSNGLTVAGIDHLITCACPATAEGCDNPYVSTGMWLAPFGVLAYESIIVATWPTPPAGISFGYHFGLLEDNTELHSDDWTGYSVFVESDQAQYSADTGTVRHNTNVWQAFPPGPGNYTFAVSNRGAIKVTICPPDAPPPPPPPEDAYGFAGSSQTLHATGENVFQSLETLDLSTWSEAIFRPLPAESIGATLYIRNCFNETTNDDQSLYLSTSETDAEGIFMELPEGETLAWVIANDDPWVWVWGHGLEPANPGHGWQVIIAWDAATVEAHCSEGS